MKAQYQQLAQDGLSHTDLIKLSLKAVEDHQLDDQEKAILDKAVAQYNKSHKDHVTLSYGSEAKNGLSVATIDLGLNGKTLHLVDPALKPLRDLSELELAELGGRKDKTAFFMALMPAALESERLTGVPASVTLAQAALESGWGKAGHHFNLFGIKGKGTDGTSKPLTTEEVIDGKRVVIQDRFAKFKDFHDGVLAHGSYFLQHHAWALENGKIKAVYADNPQKFVAAFLKGYATALDYQKTVLSIMKSNGLEALVTAAKAKPEH